MRGVLRLSSDSCHCQFQIHMRSCPELLQPPDAPESKRLASRPPTCGISSFYLAALPHSSRGRRVQEQTRKRNHRALELHTVLDIIQGRMHSELHTSHIHINRQTVAHQTSGRLSTSGCAHCKLEDPLCWNLWTSIELDPQRSMPSASNRTRPFSAHACCVSQVAYSGKQASER